ncbi:hypothetical protein F5X99DRAFT_403832 [Biscogniauxia marginata]|nr:hypothetical protein F5X99DRAFT_403832 [Biscogniauxia marginata]
MAPSAIIPGITTITFLSQESEKIVPDWLSIISTDLTGIWILYRPDRDASLSARGWTIALATAKQFILLYPKQVDDDTGEVEIICRPLTTTRHETQGSAYAHMMAETTLRYGRAAIPHVKVIQVLKNLEDSGIGNYETHNGRGLRFWIIHTLYLICGYSKKPATRSHLPDTVFSTMRRCEDTAGYTVIRPVRAGYCMPWKWSGQGFRTWQQCIEKQMDLLIHDTNIAG